MTAPAASLPAAKQQTQQPPPQQDDDSHLIALIVAALAAYTTAKALTGALKAPFKAAGVTGPTVAAVAALVLSVPQAAVQGTGPASRATTRTNLLRRAQFLLAASRRVQQAVKAARSQNQPALTAIRDALATEKQYLAQHIAASAQRVQAASAVDDAAAKHGGLLSWNAVKDSRTTPECRAASGSNFRTDRPPIVGGQPAWPGTVHPTCRCVAGPPRRGAPMLPSS